jgi:hypothetical protein
LYTGAATVQTEYARDAYATVLGDVRALVDKASPLKVSRTKYYLFRGQGTRE